MNNILLAGDKFMIQMYLKQPGFTYSVFGPFTKNKERIQSIQNNPKYDGYQRQLVSMVFEFFGKKSKGSCIKSMSTQQLVNELHKPIARKF